MARIDIGKLTQEETAELIREALAALPEDIAWPVVREWLVENNLLDEVTG